MVQPLGSNVMIGPGLPPSVEQRPLPGFEGLGPDAEVETNAKGGMQSKSPSALHLVDPGVLRLLFEKYKLEDTCDLCSDQELVEDTVANAGILIPLICSHTVKVNA